MSYKFNTFRERNIFKILDGEPPTPIALSDGFGGYAVGAVLRGIVAAPTGLQAAVWAAAIVSVISALSMAI